MPKNGQFGQIIFSLKLVDPPEVAQGFSAKLE
jgi:hypothetical protein